MSGGKQTRRRACLDCPVTSIPRAATGRATLRPWHFVLAFGLVSLLADMVYEGARSVLGPLLLAAVLAVRSDDYRLAFGVLVVPGVLVLVLLAWLRHRVPDPAAYEVSDAPPADEAHGRVRLPPVLWRYVGAVAVLSCG